MTPVPEVSSKTALMDYLQATKKCGGGGVVQATLQHYNSWEHMQAQLAYEWAIFFTEEQRQAIVIEYAIRRLDR